MKPLRTLVADAFATYGRFVATYRLFFIATPLLVTCALCLGFFNFSVYDDPRFLYSPKDAPVRAVDGDDLLYDDANRHTLQLLLQFIMSDNMRLVENSQDLTYSRNVCTENWHTCRYSNRMVEEVLRYVENNATITYPLYIKPDVTHYLPAHFHDVTLNTSISNNPEVQPLIMTRLVVLTYPLTSVNAPNFHLSADEVGFAFEERVNEFLQAHPQLHVSMYSPYILRREVRRNSEATLPFIGVTGILLVLFTALSLLTGDKLTGKPIEGLIGIGTSTLAIISASGLLFAAGMPFISQIAVVPFVALAIGIDDTYVILGAWHHTDLKADYRQRMADTLRECGTAITVTSLTDCLTFVIGALLGTPAINIFCTFMATTIAFDFLYQLTIFPAIVAVTGRLEQKGRHCILKWRRLDDKYIARVHALDEHGGPVDDWFEHTYAWLICKRPTQIVVVVLYLAYISTAIYGCMLLRPNLDASTFVVDDSPMRSWTADMEQFVWRESLVAQVYVNRMPDLNEETHRIKLLEYIYRLERLQNAVGPMSTRTWFRDFMLNTWAFIDYGSSPGVIYSAIRQYLSSSANRYYRDDVRWRSVDVEQCTHSCIAKMRLTTAFRVEDWHARARLLQQWRNLSADYPNYDIVVYDEQNFYTDQTLQLPYTTLTSLSSSLAVMALICILFINDVLICILVVLSLLSMDVGVAGFLSLWGSDLDPTIVVNILMSIGLSVDFSTHIGYRLHVSRVMAREHRWTHEQVVANALGAVGWPVCQGGISTLLCIIIMLIVPSHVVRMFARTTLLVVGIGLWHGLCILPVTVLITLKIHCPRKLRNRVSSAKLDNSISSSSVTNTA